MKAPIPRTAPWALATLLAPVLLLAMPAHAHAEPAVPADTPINLELMEAELLDVLASFAQIAGVRLETDLKPGRRVTVKWQDTPWSEALETICSEHGVDCRIEGEPPALRVSDGSPIDMSLKDAKLLEVLASFARIAGAELEADLEPGRRVTIEIQGVGWRSALDRICAGHGLACRFEGEPPVLRVAEVEKAGLADRGATSPRRREPMVLAVKLREGDREVTGLARFDWNTSTFRLGDAELGNRLDLVWLPLKPDGEGLLVLLSDCASGQVRHTGLVTPREMLGIGRGSWGWGGRENFTTKLSLRRPGKEELSDLQEAATESPACPLAEGPPVEIRFGEDGRHRVLLAGARGRAVVLAGHRGAPALALVHLGAFGDQGAKVAVVSPGYVGAALTTYSLSPSRDQGPSLVLTHLGLALHLESEEPR